MMITMITNLPPPSSPPFVAALREARAEKRTSAVPCVYVDRIARRGSGRYCLQVLRLQASESVRCAAQLSALACQHYCLLRALTEESKEPPLEKSTTVTAAATQAEINEEFIRSLERQFAKQKLEADQSRLSPRRTRK